MNRFQSGNQGPGPLPGGLPPNMWGVRLGCATAYWVALFVLITSVIAIIQNLSASQSVWTDYMPTYAAGAILVMLGYHRMVGWWPFNRRRVNPAYTQWLEAQRQRAAAQQAATGEAGEDDPASTIDGTFESPEDAGAGSDGDDQSARSSNRD